METIKAIADIVSGLGTLVVAAIVAYIAYRQHRTDKQKLRLELYERRLKVFTETMEFLSRVVAQGNTTHQDLAAFNKTRFEGTFLFPESVADYLILLHRKGVDLLKQECDTQNPQSIDEQTELLKWFWEQGKELRRVMRPYLGFDD